MNKHAAIALQSFCALFSAWVVKSGKNASAIRLPDPSGTPRLTRDDFPYVMRCAETMVRYGASCTGRKCFFRAYIAASVLRRWDVPVLINMGLNNFDPGQRTKGHCWISVNGEVIGEDEDPHLLYRTKVAAHPNGTVFWAG